MRKLVFFTITSFFFIIGNFYLAWAGINYLSAYDVIETRCQNVKHHIVAGNYVLDGIVGVCWDLIGVAEYPPKEDGPVTWCRGNHVLTSRNYEDLISELQNKFPITTPPTYFKCYHAVNDYRRMFTYIPDTTSWMKRFHIGSFFVFCSTISVIFYYLCNCFMSKGSTQKHKKE